MYWITAAIFSFRTRWLGTLAIGSTWAGGNCVFGLHDHHALLRCANNLCIGTLVFHGRENTGLVGIVGGSRNSNRMAFGYMSFPAGKSECIPYRTFHCFDLCK